MTSDRRTQLLGKLVDDPTPEHAPQRLCEVCAEVAGVSSAAMILMSEEVGYGAVSTGDPSAVRIAQLQRDYDEGPGVDAHQFGRVVHEPNLGSPLLPRWPMFQPAALDLGVRAVFGLPLRVGGIRLGALSLHSEKPGPLTEKQKTDALVMSTIAAQAVLVLQANPPPGRLVAELLTNAEYDAAVSQASGMVAIQLNISVAQALIQMRTYAFTNETTLIKVAQRMIARTLRFDEYSTVASSDA